MLPSIPTSNGELSALEDANRRVTFEKDTQKWLASVHNANYAEFAITKENRVSKEELALIVLSVELALKVEPEKMMDIGWFYAALRGESLNLQACKLAVLHLLKSHSANGALAERITRFREGFTPDKLMQALIESRPAFWQTKRAALSRYLQEIGVCVRRPETLTESEIKVLMDDGWMPFSRMIQQQEPQMQIVRGTAKRQHVQHVTPFEQFEQHPDCYLWRAKR